jgi:hypothetical protein
MCDAGVQSHDQVAVTPLDHLRPEVFLPPFNVMVSNKFSHPGIQLKLD